MNFCRTKSHIWKDKADAKKCCNGFRRIIVSGNDIPKDVQNSWIDKATGTRFAKVWVTDQRELSSFAY